MKKGLDKFVTMAAMTSALGNVELPEYEDRKRFVKRTRKPRAQRAKLRAQRKARQRQYRKKKGLKL